VCKCLIGDESLPLKRVLDVCEGVGQCGERPELQKGRQKESVAPTLLPLGDVFHNTGPARRHP